MKIQFHGQELILHHSGALYWPERKIIVVADLHLEKGSHYAKRGYFLPPYDTHKTLVKLLDVCNAYECNRLILLGDSFHDAKGYSRLCQEDKNIFQTLATFNPLWIVGNHDGDFIPENFESAVEYNIGDLIFRHEAVPDAQAEISGHFHPKLRSFRSKNSISWACFIRDLNKLILPAFGAYTGGLDVKSPAITKLLGSADYYLLGNNKVIQYQE